jgi:hypothetical protein
VSVRLRFAVALALAAPLAAPAVARGEPLPGPGPEPVRVVVCSSHHHALRHWLLAAQEGRIASSGVSVVHFDAHPDLAVPERPLQRAWREQPGRLVAMTDIASFQLAAAWVGLVSEVVWLRPPWARQLADGTRSFRLGARADGLLRVDDPSDYYVLDEGWAPAAALRDPVAVRLRVLTLPAAAAGGLVAPEAEILDIDLDGFATRNPSADRLRAAGFSDEQLDQLRRAFAPEVLRLGETPEERIAGLERVLGAVSAAAEGSWGSRLGAAWTLWRSGLGLGDLWNLAQLLAGPARDASLDVLLEEGRTLVGVPERTATPEELERSAAQLAALLESGALRPRLVTVARSVRDGFTPPHAWPTIERRTLAALRRGLGEIELVYDRGLRPAP